MPEALQIDGALNGLGNLNKVLGITDNVSNTASSSLNGFAGGISTFVKEIEKQIELFSSTANKSRLQAIQVQIPAVNGNTNEGTNGKGGIIDDALKGGQLGQVASAVGGSTGSLIGSVSKYLGPIGIGVGLLVGLVDIISKSGKNRELKIYSEFQTSLRTTESKTKEDFQKILDTKDPEKRKNEINRLNLNYGQHMGDMLQEDASDQQIKNASNNAWANQEKQIREQYVAQNQEPINKENAEAERAFFESILKYYNKENQPEIASKLRGALVDYYDPNSKMDAKGLQDFVNNLPKPDINFEQRRIPGNGKIPDMYIDVSDFKSITSDYINKTKLNNQKIQDIDNRYNERKTPLWNTDQPAPSMTPDAQKPEWSNPSRKWWNPTSEPITPLTNDEVKDTGPTSISAPGQIGQAGQAENGSKVTLEKFCDSIEIHIDKPDEAGADQIAQIVEKAILQVFRKTINDGSDQQAALA